MTHTDPIPYAQHTRWFREYLKKHTLFLVLCDKKRVQGYVRFDAEGAGLVCAIAIDADARGQGLGTILLNGALVEYAKELSGKILLAEVKKDNQASMKLFLRAGFIRHAATKTHNIYRKYC